MKSIMKIALGIFFGFVLLIGGCTAMIGGAMSSDSGDSDTKTYAEKKADERAEVDVESVQESVDEAVEETAEKTKPTKEPKPEPQLTAGQENALASAEDYLSYSAFSREGLINQLKFESYSIKDATFAVDHIKVNWNEQAAASAKDYLGYSSFSRQGLIDQLVFEGFTVEQATYGVNQTGL